jgi:hypothetical protein
LTFCRSGSSFLSESGIGYSFENECGTGSRSYVKNQNVSKDKLIVMKIKSLKLKVGSFLPVCGELA